LSETNSNHSSHFYRPDIDGLRALAVLAVVFFHAFPERLKGGFVGVDIFFVISGYLISSIILKEFEAQKFSYLNFMARRIRRIVPSLALVIICTLIAGWVLLLSSEYIGLAKEAIFGALFSSNFLFWSQAGYFDAASELKPLLHLWSLGVEEQFYILWPTILFLCYKLKVSPFKAGLFIFATSLTYCLWETNHSPSAAFYLIPSRFWELMAGSLLALINLKFPWKLVDLTSSVKNSLSFLGLFLMAAGLLWTSKTSFPGAWPILPVLGSFLFIMAGSSAVINRLIFSSKPMVYIGGISYALYLWHWPVISFTHILSGAKPLVSHINVGLVISFILAALTSSILERKTKTLSTRQAYRLCIPFLILVCVFSSLIIYNSGYESRLANQFKNNQGDFGHEDFHTYLDQNYFPCHDKILLDRSNKFGSHQRCHQTKEGTEYDVALIGDSHAEHLFLGLADIMPKENLIYLIQVGLPFWQNKDFNYIFSFLQASNTVKTVILTANWFGRFKTPDQVLQLEGTIAALTKLGKQVILTDDVHSFTFDASICFTKRRLQLLPNQCDEINHKWTSHRDFILPILTSISQKYGSELILTSDFLRGHNGYYMAKDGQLLYRDSHHLNILGSKLIGKLIKDTKQLKLEAR